MRVLVTGASGFIGRAVVEGLLHAGHRVICASRHPSLPEPGRDCEPLAVDMSKVPDANWWAPQLSRVDRVVNAVGILREQGAQTFDALHTRAPIELFKACSAAGVPVIQISALGADESAASRYHRSKREADEFLRNLPGRSAVVQPSLVYGAGGSSAGLFNQLAALPVLALPHRGSMQVQPVHVRDVVQGVLALVDSPPARTVTVAFVGPRPMSLREYLAQLRTALGIGGRQQVWPMPESWFRGGASVAGRLPGSFLDSETASMLLRGNTAPSQGFESLLQRPPLPVERFISASEAPALRTQAHLGIWLPALRVSLALLWIWTGIVSLGLYPVEGSLALLARVGLHGTAAAVALYGAAVLDLVLGVLTVAAPPRWRSAVWAAQILLIVGYTVLITMFLPEYWLHPYGPISKNLPILAAIALLWAVEPSRGARGA